MIVQNENAESIMAGLQYENHSLLTDLETCLTENTLLRIQMERAQQVTLWQTMNMRSLLERLLQETREQREEMTNNRRIAAQEASSSAPPSTTLISADKENEPPSQVLVSHSSTDRVPDAAASSNFFEQVQEERDVNLHLENELCRLYNELEMLKTFIASYDR